MYLVAAASDTVAAVRFQQILIALLHELPDQIRIFTW